MSGSCNSVYTDGNWGAKSWAWGRNHWQKFYAWCCTEDQTRSSQPALLALKSVCLWLTWFPHYMHTSALHLVTGIKRECIQLAPGFLPKKGKWSEILFKDNPDNSEKQHWVISIWAEWTGFQGPAQKTLQKELCSMSCTEGRPVLTLLGLSYSPRKHRACLDKQIGHRQGCTSLEAAGIRTPYFGRIFHKQKGEHPLLWEWSC